MSKVHAHRNAAQETAKKIAIFMPKGCKKIEKVV